MAVSDDPLLITTTTGPVQGGVSALENVRHFLGIPYAEEPSGDNAWRPPVPRAPWSEPFDATEPGGVCPQSTEGVVAQMLVSPDPETDCLTLSVWSRQGAARLPVVVWIHGGGLSSGSAHQAYYQGDNLAARGVIVVGINYRLGAQGFLALDELRDESDDGSYGNYGFRDQQLALQWVSDNVEAFGGDPDNVTIIGESAGGWSVCGHLASETSRTMFDKAVVMSGGGCIRLGDGDEAMDAGRELLDTLGCTDIECMRGLDDSDIIAAESFNPTLVSDGVILGAPAFAQATDGALDDIPLLIGSNADEATLFTIGAGEPTEADLLDTASDFTDTPQTLVDLYPAGDYATNLERHQTMWNDAVFACPALELAGVALQSFVYHYAFVSTDNPLGLGATHGAELAGLFGHREGIAIEIAEDERNDEMAEAIQQAVVSFATAGRPGPDFSPYSGGGAITVFDLPVEQVDEIRGGRCPAVIAALGGGQS